jgi:glycosyltransferase involved in cell wall biosynthesis
MRRSGEWYFHYYGDDDLHVRHEADRFGVSKRVKLHGRVPRSEALSAIKGANIAVVISSSFKEASPGIQGWIPAKLFETIGLGTPILLIAPKGSDVESLAQPTGLVRRFAGNDVDGIASFIEQMMSASPLKQAYVDSLTWQSIGTALDRVLGDSLVRFRPDQYSRLAALATQSDGNSSLSRTPENRKS